MNERIREFAEKADYNAPGGQWKEYFAELIVRECIRIPYDMWDKAELNADIALKIENRIRDHFWMFEE